MTADWHSPCPTGGDLVNDLGNKGYLVFGLILFVWELLPTTSAGGSFFQECPHRTRRASGEGQHGWVLAGPGVWEASGGGQKEASMVAPL